MTPESGYVPGLIRPKAPGAGQPPRSSHSAQSRPVCDGDAEGDLRDEIFDCTWAVRDATAPQDLRL